MSQYEVPRLKIQAVREGTPIKTRTPDAAAEIVRSICCEDPLTETVVALFLDGRSQVRGATVIAQGGRHGAVLTPADVLRPALVAGASAIILGHNHPSGDPTPSPEDDRLTSVIREAGELIRLELIDHVIVTEDEEYYSYLSEGTLLSC